VSDHPPPPANTPKRPSFGLWVWLVYAGLVAFAIPWYWPEEGAPVLLGMRAPQLTTLLGGIGIAAFSCWLFAHQIPEAEEDGGREDEPPGD